MGNPAQALPLQFPFPVSHFPNPTSHLLLPTHLAAPGGEQVCPLRPSNGQDLLRGGLGRLGCWLGLRRGSSRGCNAGGV
jgi:hypothetical protein